MYNATTNHSMVAISRGFAWLEPEQDRDGYDCQLAICLGLYSSIERHHQHIRATKWYEQSIFQNMGAQ